MHGIHYSHASHRGKLAGLAVWLPNKLLLQIVRQPASVRSTELPQVWRPDAG